jgi:hypothetical protein
MPSERVRALESVAMSESKPAVVVDTDAPPTDERRPWEAPRVVATASLEQVTLFSGTVVDGGIIFGD